MKGAVISMLVVLAIVQFVMPGEAVDCGQVNSSLASCIPFLTGGVASPSASCCAGVQNLKTLAPTTADRRAACDCIKAAAARFPTIKQDAASSLPKKCGVDINIPISKTTNCQAIN
ncbi:non-specific lipid-transfer protein A-like [Ricinus communis]|uniref:Non-specific lipid-transfer protein n=1 Tax=Ricinus communis TaxID=3988 RepID=B9RD07_RICCO|nr:non-specific lipid-transfer protein A-like [Ricinus communis]EEF50265.1 Nonspecific lipid-transfer protein A, putative [Ricinus communis]|eukprot:XP_002511596.1 non-specific lipid-transfer protein A-like [Ricinus communis]